jgi:hypothetical protein
MKTLPSIVAVVALLVGSVPAWAGQCPSLIAKAQAALEQYRKKPGLAAIKDARIAAVETDLRAAQSAHENGQHAEAEHKANSALKQLAQ